MTELIDAMGWDAMRCDWMGCEKRKEEKVAERPHCFILESLYFLRKCYDSTSKSMRCTKVTLL
jgi:hypothetical protein